MKGKKVFSLALKTSGEVWTRNIESLRVTVALEEIKQASTKEVLPEFLADRSEKVRKTAKEKMKEFQDGNE